MWKLLMLVCLAAASTAFAQPADRAIRPPVRPATEAGAETPLKVRPVYRVKQQGGGLGVFVDEAAVFHLVGEGTGRVWVVERRRRDQQLGKTTFRYEWIDGRACPALDGVIADIGKLPPVAMAGHQIEPTGWVSDTPEVTLIGPPAGGRLGDLLLRRDLMGPVSRWWRESQKRLESCWRETAPYIAGAYDLRPRLATVQEEVEVMRPY